MEEVRKQLKKTKRRKAPGPDDIPMEFIKELSDVKREIYRQTINEWWITEDIPEEQLQARVVLISKKRRHKQLGKFPTHLLTKLHLQNNSSNYSTQNFK